MSFNYCDTLDALNEVLGPVSVLRSGVIRNLFANQSKVIGQHSDMRVFSVLEEVLPNEVR